MPPLIAYRQALRPMSRGSAQVKLHRLITEDMAERHCSQVCSERRVKATLAWHAYQCGPETWGRIERLYECAHPVFGSYFEMGPPSTVLALILVRDARRNIATPCRALAAEAVRGEMLCSVS